jgi:hypothetical protein
VAGTRRGVRRVLAATETLGVQLLRLAMLATMGTLGRRSTLGLDHGQRHIRVLAARHTMPANTPVTGIFNTINKHHGPQKAIRRTDDDREKEQKMTKKKLALLLPSITNNRSKKKVLSIPQRGTEL